MGKKDPRIDAYIRKSAPFAQPVLTHIRDTVHQACPDVVETVKWSMPHFDYHGPMVGMAAFKQHCALNFWKGKLIEESLVRDKGSMGQFGRITSLKDLPPKRTLLRMIKKAAKLNEAGTKIPNLGRGKRQPIPVPSYFAAALKKNKNAKATFDDFAPSHRREYLEWITEAKTEPTRAKRMAQTLEWLAEGKQRHWKHAR